MVDNMNLLFRIFLAINATSWMYVVYYIKCGKTFLGFTEWICSLILLFIPMVLSWISLKFLKFFGDDTLNECQEFSLADNEFLPTYLGYFFVSLSVPNDSVMVYLYFIVFVFTFLSQTQYFNPIFLVFGYHYYHILTKQGTRVFVITKGNVFRNKNDIVFENLKRINDTTYIQFKEGSK